MRANNVIAKRTTNLQRNDSRHLSMPLLIFTITLILSGFSYYYVAQSVEARNRIRFDNAVSTLQNEINVRMNTYLQVLKATRSLYNASESVELQEFRTYINGFDLQYRYPGFLGVGFARSIEAKDREAFITDMRKQVAENYHIWPQSNNSRYVPIVFLEPLDARNQRAIGFDMFSEEVQRAAMESAQDSGEPVATGILKLMQETDQNSQTGFIIFLPVYQHNLLQHNLSQHNLLQHNLSQHNLSQTTLTARREALLGFVYSPFRTKEFFQVFADSSSTDLIEFQIYDGMEMKPDKLIFESVAPQTFANNTSSSFLTRTVRMEIAERTWAIKVISNQLFLLDSQSIIPPMVLLCGLIVSLLIFGVAWVQAKGRTTAEQITRELSKSEQELRKSEARIRSIIDSNLIGIVFWNIRGQVIDANRVFLKMTGFTEEDLKTGKICWDEITPSEYRHLDQQALLEMNQSKTCQPFEKEYICKDGKRIPILIGATYLPDSQSNGIAFIIDITERKQAEEALHKSEMQLHQILAGIDSVVWVTNITRSEMLYINEAYERIWGKSCKSLYENPKSFIDSIHPEDRFKLTDLIQKDRDKEFSEEYRIIRPDGSIRWIMDSSFTIKDANDNVYRIAGVATDITEQKQVAERLREQAVLLDIANDAILVCDLNNRILFWNRSAQQLYGVTAQQAIGQDVQKILYKEPTPKLLEADECVLENGNWVGELSQINAAGHEIIVESRWTLVRDQAGNPKSKLIVNTDITEQKRLAAQLLRAQRLESIGTLASGIAHDLNNVLTPTLLSMDLLKRRLPDDKRIQILNTVETSLHRGADLIKQVLSFARGIEGERAIIDVKNLILEVEKIVRETFSRSIKIKTAVMPDLYQISSNTTQLQQILMNLCVNARDAMPNGGELNISAENIYLDEPYCRLHIEAKVGNYIVLTIADTGSGIPAEIIDKIFDPFFTTKEFGKGTGIGLSTVIGIVKSMGGFITVWSEVEIGTQFKVYLPAINQPEDSDSAETSDELLTGRGETLLIIDDEFAIREIVRDSLEKADYKVLTADNGAEGIAIYVEHKEDIKLVITDMNMPVMNGVATIRALKKISPKIKIIVATGLITPELKSDISNLEIEALLLKPYTIDSLLQMLAKLLVS